jgi:hypothetical protein
MGTRADFYVGRGPDAEWIGSIAWDGHSASVSEDTDALAAKDEATHRKAVASFLASRNDGTTPEMGWPWPWSDSGTTDYAYAFDAGQVWGCRPNAPWWPADQPEPKSYDEETLEDIELPGEPSVFPDMSAVANVTLGQRSGVMLFGLPEGEVAG